MTVKYKLTLVEKKIILDSVMVEIDPDRGFSLANEMRKLKIANRALGNKKAKIMKEIID